MSNFYLQILELQPGATPEEIRKAYRRLAKIYHPDVNSSEEAHEKFLAIKEAYHFLIDTGPRPHQEEVRYDYDPGESEFEAKRQEARKRARQAKFEQMMYQKYLKSRMLFYFKYVLLISTCYNAIYLIDYFWEKPESFQIRNIEEIMLDYGEYNYLYKLEYDQGVISWATLQGFDYQIYDQFTLTSSAILNHKVKVSLNNSIDNPSPYVFEFNRFYIYLVYLILFFSALYGMARNENDDTRITLSITIGFLFFWQVLFFNIF